MEYLEVVRLHAVWRNMRSRCENPDNVQFKTGGRGIQVDPRWRDFNVFCEWAISNGSHKGLHLDRRDNDGPYSPEYAAHHPECQLAEHAPQQRHHRVR